MNHKELVAAMAAKMNAPESVVADMLAKTVETCRELMMEQKTIGLHGFGNLEVRKKEERVSVHPATQVRTLIPPKYVVSFKQSNILKDKLKSVSNE